MLNMFYYAHSGLRWLVVLAIVVAFGFMLFSLFTNREQDRLTRLVMLVFSSLVGVQFLVGLIYYLIYGANRTYDYQVEHVGVMTLAVVVAHLYIPFRKRAGTRNYYIASTIVILLTTAMIVYGISSLDPSAGRWSMAPMYPPGA